jgi:hypothetical protein
MKFESLSGYAPTATIYTLRQQCVDSARFLLDADVGPVRCGYYE